MDLNLVVTLILGCFGIFVTIASTGGAILLIALRAVRAVDESTSAKIEAVRQELLSRIEAVRVETKNDRHNYVDKIDGVLSEIRNDFLEMAKTVSEGFGRLETLSEIKDLGSR